MSCLPFRTSMSAILHALLERDLIEQSALERLARAAFAAGLLWVAIVWAWS